MAAFQTTLFINLLQHDVYISFINEIYKKVSKNIKLIHIINVDITADKNVCCYFPTYFSLRSDNMKTLNMNDLQQVSGGFDIGKTVVSDTGGFVGTGAGALAGTFTGMALGAIAGPGGMAAGGYIGGAVGGYLGSKLGSFVGEKSFGY